jgi:hypothetical protein
MEGAREYAMLFETKQYGKLYIVSSEHARGKTFRIYILPEGEKAISNGRSNSPLNKDAVCVYGVTGGNLGWTETYGWLHKGAWVNYFECLVKSKQIERDNKRRRTEATTEERDEASKKRIKELLSNY